MSVSAVEFLQGLTPFWSLKWPLVELQFFSYFWIKLLGFTTVLMKLFTTCKQFLFLCLCEDTITHREVSVTPCVRSFLRLLAVLSVSSRVALAGVQLRTSCSVSIAYVVVRLCVLCQWVGYWCVASPQLPSWAWCLFVSVTPALEDKSEHFAAPQPCLGFTWEAW